MSVDLSRIDLTPGERAADLSADQLKRLVGLVDLSLIHISEPTRPY